MSEGRDRWRKRDTGGVWLQAGNTAISVSLFGIHKNHQTSSACFVYVIYTASIYLADPIR